MIFDAKFLTLLIFIIVNFVIIFAVKTRTSIVISLIISHLTAIVFLANIILSYEAFKETVLALVIYSIAILFLVSNHKDVEEPYKIRLPRQSIILYGAIFFIGLALFFGIFFTIKNIPAASKEVSLKSLKAVEITKTIDDKIYLKHQLLDNFLFKKSSDIILLIVASSSILLILSQKKQ